MGTAILFPLGVRLSTWVTAVAFVGLAVTWRDRRPLLAGAAWLTGFEAAFQVASLLLGRLPLGIAGPIFFIGLGAITVAWATRRGVSPDWRLLAVAIAFFAVWVATGFHLNGHQHGMFSLHTRIADFNTVAELLNEASKTLWALAYLLPLLAARQAARPVAMQPKGVPPRPSVPQPPAEEAPRLPCVHKRARRFVPTDGVGR